KAEGIDTILQDPEIKSVLKKFGVSGKRTPLPRLSDEQKTKLDKGILDFLGKKTDKKAKKKDIIAHVVAIDPAFDAFRVNTALTDKKRLANKVKALGKGMYQLK